MKSLTEEQKILIKKPLPSEAITKHPTKTYLSSIKAIYVTERLNDVFGVGAWQIRTNFEKDAGEGMIVVKVTLEIPEYGIYYESFGGNDNGGEKNKNFDLGDAYKGATTDAITKICSYIGIGIDVFKGKQNKDFNTEEEKPQWIKGNSNICPSCTTENEIKQNSKGNKYFKCSTCGALVSVTIK